MNKNENIFLVLLKTIFILYIIPILSVYIFVKTLSTMLISMLGPTPAVVYLALVLAGVGSHLYDTLFFLVARRFLCRTVTYSGPVAICLLKSPLLAAFYTPYLFTRGVVYVSEGEDVRVLEHELCHRRYGGSLTPGTVFILSAVTMLTAADLLRGILSIRDFALYVVIPLMSVMLYYYLAVEYLADRCALRRLGLSGEPLENPHPAHFAAAMAPAIPLVATWAAELHEAGLGMRDALVPGIVAMMSVAVIVSVSAFAVSRLGGVGWTASVLLASAVGWLSAWLWALGLPSGPALLAALPLARAVTDSWRKAAVAWLALALTYVAPAVAVWIFASLR